jgi:deazaflavin-dependent oxidoreductase (nitroreductase family)
MPFPRVLANGRVNKVLLRFAGHAAFADLEHVGRKSGAVRHTPVRAFRRQDRVVIGINFGRQSDWLKNVQAAGGCRMRLAGERLELGEPRVIPVAPTRLRIGPRGQAQDEAEFAAAQFEVVTSAWSPATRTPTPGPRSARSAR